MSDGALPIALQGLGLAAGAAADIASILSALIPDWADGMDVSFDFQTGVQYGTPVYLSDVHANRILMRDADGLSVTKAANVACREEGVGLQVVPAYAQLVGDPLALSTEYTSTGGTGTIAQDAVDPAGNAASAWTLNDTSTGGSFFRQKNFTVSNDSVMRVASVAVKKTTGTPDHCPSVLLTYAGGTGKTSEAVIETTTGQLSINNPANAIWWTEDGGDFWHIIGAIANNGTGNTTFAHSLYPARRAAFTDANSTAAVGSTVFAWPNMYVGSTPVPPILDDITAGGNIASLPVVPGQAVAGFVTLDIQDLGSGSVRAFVLDDGTASNYFALEHSSGRAVLKLVAATASQASVDIGPWRVGRQTIAFAVGSNYVWGRFVRGLTVAADTSATFPSGFTKLGFGGLTGDTSERRARVVVEKVGLVYGTADALAADRAYKKAVAAHGNPPLAWDNFDRADGVPGSLPTLQPWVQVPGGAGGRVVAAISSKALVATDSGGATTAAYTAVNVGQNVAGMRARIAFGSGTTGGGGALIITPAAPPSTSSASYVTDNSIHIAFTDAALIVGFFENAAPLSTFATLTYPENCALDGTEYEIGFDVVGDTATFYMPYSAPITLTDPRFVSLMGHWATFEHFWSTGQCQPKFLGAEVF